ncbi:MAG: DsbA family protein [Deltaproteobacteria bacterium]|nr:DsbA family protein [Deltaproteobacteria bacterium]
MVKEFDGKVRVVYMNMVVHENVRQAHQYGCAAAKQGKFIDYKDAFWTKSFGAYRNSGGKDASTLTPEFILRWAGEAGLDADKLKSEGEGADCQRRVEEDMRELRKFRVGGTPNFFVNGQHIGGRIPKEAMAELVKEKLKIAEASGVSGSDYYQKEILGKGEKTFKSKADARKSKKP